MLVMYTPNMIIHYLRMWLKFLVGHTIEQQVKDEYRPSNTGGVKLGQHSSSIFRSETSNRTYLPLVADSLTAVVSDHMNYDDTTVKKLIQHEGLFYYYRYHAKYPSHFSDKELLDTDKF